MKIRFFILCIGLMLGQLTEGLALIPPSGTPPLPNYDVRSAKLASPQTLTAPASTNAQQDQAVLALKSQVPDVRVTRDGLLGTPSLIAAPYGFLSGPDGKGRGVSEASIAAIPANDPNRVIKAFLNEHSALFGHDANVLTSARAQRDYVTKHNGLRTVIWEQTLDDIPVFEGLLIGHITRNGELVSISSHFIPDVAKAGDAGTPNRSSLVSAPVVSAAKAVSIAASNVGADVPENSLTVADAPRGAEKQQTLNAANLLGPTMAQLVWLPLSQDSMRLCWRVILTTRPRMDRYLIVLDAETGEVLVRYYMTEHVSPATYNVYTSDSPSPFSPGWPTPSALQPPFTNRVLVTLSALDLTASPAGWVPDGPSPTTTGNNAMAFLDRNLDLVPDVPPPTAVNRVFDFPLNLAQQPTAYQSASTVQLFYRANWYHDRLYELGFTEAAGNYQTTNFNRGGLQNDPIICLVQAGADVGQSDNSFFVPAPDGSSGYCVMFVFDQTNPFRDGSLDQEVVVHELTHGTSGRLVGGGVGISALQTSGMGEGWSDFYSLCLLSEATDDVNANYAEGGYVTYQFFGLQDNYYFGIRRYPYTTDMSKNPLTFKDIDPTKASTHPGVPTSPLLVGSDPSEVHNQGEVWCVTLREVWASLVTKSGWAVGNELTLQLVTDGMKLSPANPTFLQARDAIIQADQIDTGGDNFAELWAAFAKRGMGFSAKAPPSSTTTGVVEAYDLPPAVGGVSDGILEVTITPPSSSVLIAGDSNPIFIRVTDLFGVTNATIVATASSGPNPVFSNNGALPDVRANDSTYSAPYVVPGGPSVTINFVITAPGKTNCTNTVTYFIVPPPPNDYFTNAIKVPAAGASYLSNNKLATLELGEPLHDDIGSVAGSLWWKWTATFNTNILLDTSGSGEDFVLAVYTGGSVVALTPVAATNFSAAGRLTYLKFNAASNTTYQIAVASPSASAVGSLRLRVAPGGQPDTNAPLVTVTSPLNGQGVTNFLVTFSGTANDPQPDASGVSEVFLTVNGSASLVASGTTNWSLTFGLSPGMNTIQVFAKDFSGNISAPISVVVSYFVLAPPNDFFVHAITLTNQGQTNVDSTAATKELGEPEHAGNAGGRSVWWSYQPASDGVLRLSTSNSAFDTLLAVYTGSSVGSLTPIAANDDAYPGAPGGFSRIDQAVRAGQTYQMAVDGYDGAAGMVRLAYQFAPGTVYHLTTGSSAGGAAQVTSLNSLGGVSLMPGTAGDFANNTTLVLTPVPDRYYQFDTWTGSLLSLDNPLTIVITSNMNLTANFSPIIFTDGFESGDLQHIAWTTGGNAPWFVQTNVVAAGRFAARSGVINNSQSSSLFLSASFRAGIASFDYRVSSELNFDLLDFYVDGVLLQHWSGDAGWASYAFPLSATNHTLEWRYTKDASISSGLDAAFIDNVNLPLIVPLNNASPAQLSLQRQTDPAFFVNLVGQTNQRYVLQVSSNLVDWVNLSTNVATGGFLRLADPASETNDVRFYRAIAVP